MLTSVMARSDKPIRPTPKPQYAYDRYEISERKENTNWLYQQLGIATEG